MGAGSAWGDREEFLHPRDSHGRFRNTWRMPQGAADAISKFLDSFSPKSFGSDAEAQSWVHNESRKNRLGTNAGSAITNFVKGFSNVNANLRAGKADPQAAQMLKGAEPLPNDLILTKTVEPSAFGLDPTHIANVEELTGKLIHDPGFTSANIGTPNPPTGPGPHIQMTIATPAGTKAIIPQVSSPTSEVVLTPDQNIRVTKVTPDGKGGYYMMAVATPGGTPKEKSTPLHEAPPAPAPLNLPPKPGEQPATPGSAPAAPESPAQTPTPSAPSATAPAAAPAAGPATPSNAPSAPRTEPNVVEALTPGGTPTPTAQPEVPATPEVPLEGAPQPPVLNFRQVVKEAGVPAPSAGKRREAWNKAYLGLARSKNPRHPEDVVRELDSDIAYFKDLLSGDVKSGTDSGPLPDDIKAIQQLRDLIQEKYGLGKPKEPQTPEEHRSAAQDLLSKPVADENAARKQRLEAEAHIRQADQAEKGQKAVARRGGATAADKAVTAQLQPGDKILVAKNEAGEWSVAKQKTGATTLTVTRTELSGGRRGRRTVHGKNDDGKDISIENIAGHQTFFKKTEPKKAAAPRGPKPISNEEMPNKAAIRREARANTPPPTPEQIKRAEEIKAQGIKSGEEVAAKNAASNAAAKKVSDPWLEKAGIKDSELTDHERTGVALMADMVARGKISRPEAARRLRTPGKNGNLTRIADSIIARPSPHAPAAKVAKEATPAAPSAQGALPETATIAQLRQIAKERGIKIPSKLTRKDDIRAHLEGGNPQVPAKVQEPQTPATPGKPRVYDRVAAHVLDLLPPDARKRILDDLAPEDRKAVDEAVARVKGADAAAKIGPKEAIPEKATIAQLRQIAKDRNVKIPSKLTRKDDIRKHLEEAANPESTAVTRQANIDEARKIADITGELDHLLDNDASPKALISRVGAWYTRTGVSEDVANPILKVVETGDKKKIDAELTRLRKEAKLGIVGGKRGETVAFNPTHHEVIGGGVKPGEPVRVSRTGHEATLPNGEKVHLGKAIVESVGTTGRGDIPKGADIETAIGHLDPKVARDSKAILGDVRSDLASGKKTPAQIGRELERTANGISTHSVLRHGGHGGNLTPERQAELQALRRADDHQASELKRLADHLKSSRRAPEPKLSTETAPVKKAVPAKKAVTKIEAPQELKQAVAKTSVADLRKQAADEGIKVPASARTKQQVMDHIVQEMAKRELARRGTARATEPRAAKVATPAQKQEVVDLMREKAVAKVAKVAEAPAKKAAPAKVAKKAEPEVKAPSARSVASRRFADQAKAQQAAETERTGVQAGKFSDKPILKNHWGVTGGEINFHDHGVIGRALSRMGEDQKLEIDGQPLANVVGKLATEGVRGQKSSKEVVAELSKIRDRMPEGSKARSELDQAVKDLSAPQREINIPSGTPKPLRDLAKAFQGIPVASRTHDEFGRKEQRESELSLLAQIMDEYSKGQLSGMRLRDRIQSLHNRRHESTEGKFEIDRAVRTAIQELNAIGLRNLNPPKTGD